MCRNFPKFLNYVERTTLNPSKEKIVRSWIDHVLHLNNTTTSKFEYAHGRLTEYLMDSKGDLVRGWDAMDNMLQLQFIEI